MTTDGTSGVLNKLFGEKPEKMFVVIRSWTYKVSGSLPKHAPSILFQWEGAATTISKEKISVVGAFIVAEDGMQDEWSGHALEVGDVGLIAGTTEANASVWVDIRVSGKCCEELWKAFVSGQTGDHGGVGVQIIFGKPSADDWLKIKEADPYKNPSRLLAIREFLVIGGGEFQTPS